MRTSEVVVLAGSPNPVSRTHALLRTVAAHMAADGLRVRMISVRDLPGEALLHGRESDPAIIDLVTAVAQAHGVVVGTPVYKAAYSGALKVMLDVLPRNALAGKVVLPVATGGNAVHLLDLDQALRLVLEALGADQVLPAHLVHEDRFIFSGGAAVIDKAAAAGLPEVVARFGDAMRDARVAGDPSSARSPVPDRVSVRS